MAQKQQYTVDFENEEGIIVTVKNVWGDDAPNAIFEAQRHLAEPFGNNWRCIGVDRQ